MGGGGDARRQRDLKQIMYCLSQSEVELGPDNWGQNKQDAYHLWSPMSLFHFCEGIMGRSSAFGLQSERALLALKLSVVDHRVKLDDVIEWAYKEVEDAGT